MKSAKIQIALIAILLFGSAVTLVAQDKKKAMPDEQAWLQKFAGNWTAKVVSTDAANKTTSLTSHMTFTPVADGTGLYATESADDPKMGKMRFSYLLGYDPYEKKVHFFAVGNWGICHDHDCTWKSPDNFYIEHNSMREGKAYKEEINIVFRDKNTMEFTETDYLGGSVTDKAQGTFKRDKK